MLGAHTEEKIGTKFISGRHHSHKWSPCNVEKFKMSAAKLITQEDRVKMHMRLCVVLGSYSHLMRSYKYLYSGENTKAWAGHES